MSSIEIDFDVFKALTALRESEQVSFNDVLRRILKLPPKVKAPGLNSEREADSVASDKAGWVSKGIHFPSGTLFKVNYKGKLYTAKVENGMLVMGGESYDSLSAAGIAVTNGNVNGWRFWQCKRPSDAEWVLADTLRG